MKNLFTKTVLLSLLGHLTAFSIFSFSFGSKIPPADYAPVSFWGGLLHNSDLMPKKQAVLATSKKDAVSKLHKIDGKPAEAVSVYFKPAVGPVYNYDKIPFLHKETLTSKDILARREPVVTFYPQLPENFLLYFQNRQAVHIELIYNIVSGEKASTVNIKRKISSGNLEADLFTMRYISHYLFIQQPGFPSDNWQTVKIDLSTKND